MISLSSAELNAWIAAFFFPLVRVLALLMAAPPFSNTALRSRTRLMIGLAVTLAIAPSLAEFPAIDPVSAAGLLVIAQQIMIGFAMGFSMRLVFSAIDLAGNSISMQMGLGFATAYDPQSASQTGVLSELLGMISLLLFVGVNGHLMVLATLAHSFTVIPIGTFPAPESWLNVARAVGFVFSSGLLLALPIVTILLITNIALGILGRVAPQLNLMAIGFPITITLGFSAIYVSFSYLGDPLQKMFEAGLLSMLGNFVLR